MLSFLGFKGYFLDKLIPSNRANKDLSLLINFMAFSFRGMLSWFRYYLLTELDLNLYLLLRIINIGIKIPRAFHLVL